MAYRDHMNEPGRLHRTERVDSPGSKISCVIERTGVSERPRQEDAAECLDHVATGDWEVGHRSIGTRSDSYLETSSDDVCDPSDYYGPRIDHQIGARNV